jgi:hypothetical protein
MVAAWAVPLAGLGAAAWYRPGAATTVLAAATALALLLSLWFAVAPQAWRSFEDHTGPVRALVTFVIAVPLGLLGRDRPVPAGVLLLVLGLGPAVLAGTAGGVPPSASSSTGAASVPALAVGGLYLLSALVSRTRPPAGPADRDLRRSWTGVALVPVAFVLAVLVGEGLLSALEYDPGTRVVPVGAVLLAGVPAVLILVAPGLAAAFYGRRAYRAGCVRGAVPAWIGATTVVLALAVNVAALIVGR